MKALLLFSVVVLGVHFSAAAKLDPVAQSDFAWFSKLGFPDTSLMIGEFQFSVFRDTENIKLPPS